MLIDINQEKWEEIRTKLQERGMLSRAAALRGQLIQFPEPAVVSWDICVGSED